MLLHGWGFTPHVASWEPYAQNVLTIDYGERRATGDGRPVQLTAKEYGTLAELSANAGLVLTYEHLLRRT